MQVTCGKGMGITCFKMREILGILEEKGSQIKGLHCTERTRLLKGVKNANVIVKQKK